MSTGKLSRGDLTTLQKLSGINATTISRILNGSTKNPGVKTMQSIEKALVDLASQKAAPIGKTEVIPKQSRKSQQAHS